jgi:hypothetical protein
MARRVRARDLDARDDRLPGAGWDVERVEEGPRGRPGRGRGGCPLDLSHRGGELLVRRRGTAPGVAVAVAHALVQEAELEALDQLEDCAVAREDVLRAHLDDRAVRQPLRPDTPADPVASLEQHDLGARADELVGRDEPARPAPTTTALTARPRAVPARMASRAPRGDRTARAGVADKLGA